MSKPTKDLIVAEYRNRFRDVSGGVVVEIRGMSGTDNTRFRTTARGKGVRVTVLKNSLARRAFHGGALEPLGKTLKGPSALLYGEGSVVDIARDVVKWATQTKELELKSAVLDGILFEGAEGVVRLSRFPTREEAQARVVSLALAPARNAVGVAVAPGSRVVGILKEIEKRLEKGGAIARKN